MYVGNCNQFANTLIDTIHTKQASNYLVSATSVHGIVYANQNLSFKNILHNFYCNLPDGMPLTWVGHLKGYKQMTRCTGIDTFQTVMSSTSKYPIKHFFCGGKDGIAIELQNASASKLGNSNIVGTFSPPFREMTKEEFKDLGTLINASGANVLWIGLSTPKQEIFATELSKYIHVNYIITVGAVFDFFTNNLQRAPRWIQNIGLEWLYRLCKEPRRLFKRYAEIVPMFIWLNLKSIFK